MMSFYDDRSTANDSELNQLYGALESSKSKR